MYWQGGDGLARLVNSILRERSYDWAGNGDVYFILQLFHRAVTLISVSHIIICIIWELKWGRVNIGWMSFPPSISIYTCYFVSHTPHSLYPTMPIQGKKDGTKLGIDSLKSKKVVGGEGPEEAVQLQTVALSKFCRFVSYYGYSWFL